MFFLATCYILIDYCAGSMECDAIKARVTRANFKLITQSRRSGNTYSDFLVWQDKCKARVLQIEAKFMIS